MIRYGNHQQLWREQARQHAWFPQPRLNHSKRVNPPEVTINNKLKRANALYIGQQFQVMRTFMSTCEFHTAVTQNERSGTTEMTAQKAHSRLVLPIRLYLFNICYIHDTQANDLLFLPGIQIIQII